MTLHHLSWGDFDSLIAAIILELDRAKFIPQVVVGVARGGLPPMASLASALGIRHVGVVFSRKTADDSQFAEMLPRAEFEGLALSGALNGESILLVDNIVQTGQTISNAAQALEHAGAGEQLVASLCSHKQRYSFRHYSPMFVEPDDWVAFPWDHK